MQAYACIESTYYNACRMVATKIYIQKSGKKVGLSVGDGMNGKKGIKRKKSMVYTCGQQYRQ